MTLFQLAPIFGNISPASPLPSNIRGAAGINLILNNAVILFFAAAAVSFVIMFLWGAVQIILSQGDKEAIAKARGKITWAIIGIFLIALSYFIFEVLQDITGFRFFLP